MKQHEKRVCHFILTHPPSVSSNQIICFLILDFNHFTTVALVITTAFLGLLAWSVSTF